MFEEDIEDEDILENDVDDTTVSEYDQESMYEIYVDYMNST